MRWFAVASLAASLTIAGGVETLRTNRFEERIRERQTRQPLQHEGVPHDRWTRDGPVPKRFDNANTTEFAINGTEIPDVDFDIGEAYAGRISITEDLDSDEKFYFWFQPSPNPDAKKEIVVWLNGGPGCSSLKGLVQENGPFLWQTGTFKPVPNPWGWHHLTNVLWVDQPMDSGFSKGKTRAKDEADVAKQFLGFFKNFVDKFSLHGYKVYIAGESYAGMYCPYIADAMIDAEDKTYFDLNGMLLYDPTISFLEPDIMIVPFTDYHHNLFPLNDTYTKQIHEADEKCGYAAFRHKYLTYPPAGQLPLNLPGVDPDTHESIDGCLGLIYEIFDAVSAVNPCFNVYQIATTCPLRWDVLGSPGTTPYLPDGATVYLNRDDVKKAMNAPLDVKWQECGGIPFEIAADLSMPSSVHAIGSVIDHTKNVIISHGDLDMVLLANITLMAIQNMTFGGKLGFQSKPIEPFYVPYHSKVDRATMASAGVVGTAHTERGLTYAGVALSGHMVPEFAPSAAYRQLEFLLGRVDSLNSTKPFTTDAKFPQPDSPLGNGIASPGYE